MDPHPFIAIESGRVPTRKEGIPRVGDRILNLHKEEVAAVDVPIETDVVAVPQTVDTCANGRQGGNRRSAILSLVIESHPEVGPLIVLHFTCTVEGGQKELATITGRVVDHGTRTEKDELALSDLKADHRRFLALPAVPFWTIHIHLASFRASSDHLGVPR